MKVADVNHINSQFGQRLTTAEVAEITRYSVQTIRVLLEGGVICGNQRIARGRWLVEEACLRAWMANEPCEHRQERKTKRLNLKRPA